MPACDFTLTFSSWDSLASLSLWRSQIFLNKYELIWTIWPRNTLNTRCTDLMFHKMHCVAGLVRQRETEVSHILSQNQLTFSKFSHQRLRCMPITLQQRNKTSRFSYVTICYNHQQFVVHQRIKDALLMMRYGYLHNLDKYKRGFVGKQWGLAQILILDCYCWQHNVKCTNSFWSKSLN